MVSFFKLIDTKFLVATKFYIVKQCDLEKQCTIEISFDKIWKYYNLLSQIQSSLNPEHNSPFLGTPLSFCY